MNYTKPEVAVLGKAAVVIESTIRPKNGGVYDLGQFATKAATPAYDLDE
jgi:hypothetical protein